MLRLLIDKVNREDIWKEAAIEALLLPTFTSTSRGRRILMGSLSRRSLCLLEEFED